MSALTFPDVPLLGCPFCGSAGKWYRTGRDVGVECAELEDCPGRAQTDVYAPENALMAAVQWNSRNDQAADHYESVLATREELLSACRQQHDAIDVLMAQLIGLDPTFRPTKNAAWPAVIAGNAAIAKAIGSEA